MFGFSSRGSFDNTEKFLKQMTDASIFQQLSRFGEEGVAALSQATPQDSGETAMSWFYEIVQEKGSWSIIWGNTHDAGGTPVAVLIQLGHGTGTGGYVEGIDFINPALKPIFDRMTDAAVKVVNRA